MSGPLRKPPEETVDLYPGLVVCDNRQTGSITLSASRLPVWAIMADLCERGWSSVKRGWPQVTEYGWDGDRFAAFLADLTESRGEFARLLLVLADVQRRGRRTTSMECWTKRDRKVLAAQLRRCLACLEAASATMPPAAQPGEHEQERSHAGEEAQDA